MYLYYAFFSQADTEYRGPNEMYVTYFGHIS